MYNIYLRHAYPNELYHHGIKGQRWGVRRFQNPDGSLTPAGKKRYYNTDGTLTKKGKKEYGEHVAEEAISSLTKMGFKDDNSRDPKDHWLAKNIKTKHGDVEFFTNIDTTPFGMNGGTGSHPITASDIRTAVSGVNKYGSKAMSKLKAELDSDIKNGYWGSADVKLGNIETVYAVKFRDLSAPSCEISVPVKDKSTNRTYGWLSVEMDPVTGNLENVSYND